MSPQAGFLLQDQIVPRLCSAIPKSILCVGAEDHHELIQDATVMAVKMIDRVESQGKLGKVSASNIAYYTLQHLKSGRRANGTSSVDIMGRPNSGGSQFKHKFYATCSAVVSKVNKQRSVEIRLMNCEGWVLAGNVTIPANFDVPQVGAVVEVRYLYAFRQSGALYQPTYLGERDDVAVGECKTTQLKYKAGEDDE